MVRRWVAAVALFFLAVPALLGQPGVAPAAPPAAVPAFRQADNVAIITVRGEINAVTEQSIRRRIKQAEASRAGAMVFEIDSPGGELGAVLEITNAIKASTIANTVAWVHPDAYSGGAMIALACREIVTSDPASMGDAFPITMSADGIRGLSVDERTKILPVLLSDVADSARRGGFDEYLAQAIVVDGIELWAVRDTTTNRWIFINEAEHRILFDGEPARGKPVLTSVPGGRGDRGDTQAVTPPADAANGTDAPAPPAQEEQDADDRAGDGPAPGADRAQAPAQTADQTAFKPASDSVADLQTEISMGIDTASQRPTITAADRGRFVEPVYVCDGTGPVVLRQDQLDRFGLRAAEINNDEELRAFFGASTLARIDMSWSEHLVGFLTTVPVRGVLIVVFLIALFVEMAMPGTLVAGSIAVVALLALIAPPAMIGMAGWWEVLAIVLGIVFILIEVFLIPGFGLIGVVGLIALFAGLVGTFIPDSSGNLFPGGAADRGRLLGGMATVLLALATAGVGMYFLGKHFGSLPFLSRLVHDPANDHEADDAAQGMFMAAAPIAGPEPRPGDAAVATTALRPSGRILIGDQAADGIARRGIIDAGARVRLVKRDGFSWIVEPIAPQPTITQTSTAHPGEDPRATA